jgi:enoyl-CoA hydratase/carnithine racemase
MLRDGPVMVITLDRADAHNAVDPETALALDEAALVWDRRGSG